MISVNSKTKLAGLLGYPLDHTFSPIMHNASFNSKGLNNVYLPIEVKPENFEVVIKAIPMMNFIGFNVTRPFKIEVVNYLDEIDEFAKFIGAVNTVVVNNGKLKGYNTDGTGFLYSLEECLASKVEGKNVFILGSGGAARSICMVLALNKVKRIYICNRTIEKAEALSRSVNEIAKDSTVVVPMEYSIMKQILNNTDIFINTTNVGTYPNVNQSPIDCSLLNNEMVVCDIIYNPQKTKLLLEAEKLGCKTLSGLGMLVYQGAEAFELWTGVRPPIELMFKVVSEALTVK